MHPTGMFRTAAAAALLLAAAPAMTLALPTSQELDARGFQYQNNDISFSLDNLPGDTLVVGGSYVTSDLSISAGQDPNGRNVPGQMYPLSNGHLEFQVGRHKTTPVAAWWDARVCAGCNNYKNSQPGSLNFAFTGTLQLVLSNGVTVYLDNLALAQGSNDSGNNWWMGGPTCANAVDPPLYDQNIACRGRDQNGAPLKVTFLVGFTAGLLDKVYIRQISWL